MSNVAKYTAALAASVLVSVLGFGLVGGGSVDLILQPYFWVVSLSLTALAGLAMGNGIGDQRYAKVVRMAPAAARPASIALAA